MMQRQNEKLIFEDKQLFLMKYKRAITMPDNDLSTTNQPY